MQEEQSETVNSAPPPSPERQPEEKMEKHPAKKAPKKKSMVRSLPPAANDPEPTKVARTLTEEEADSLSDIVVKELIHQAVNNKHIDVFMQPVVRLPQRRVRFFEMYGRIRARPGLYVPAGRYLKLAEEEKLVEEIDTLVLTECMKTLKETAHLKKPAPVIINISSDTLKNTAFMNHLLAFLAKNRPMASRLIFELKQRDYETLSPGLLKIIKALGTLGCGLSLDHVENIDCDVGDLLRFNVRFMKVNASLLIKAMGTERGFADMQRIKSRIESNGIGVIIEKIENEYILKESLDYGIHYGQGYLFGKPELQSIYGTRKVA